jgi:hypothetical protein
MDMRTIRDEIENERSDALKEVIKLGDSIIRSVSNIIQRSIAKDVPCNRDDEIMILREISWYLSSRD